MEMRSMADNEEKMTGLPSKKEKYYPTVRMMEDQMPELKGKKTGDKCMVMMEMMVKGTRLVNAGKATEYEMEMRKAGYHAKEKGYEKA